MPYYSCLLFPFVNCGNSLVPIIDISVQYVLSIHAPGGLTNQASTHAVLIYG